MPTTIAELTIDILSIFAPLWPNLSLPMLGLVLFLISTGAVLIRRTLRALRFDIFSVPPIEMSDNELKTRSKGPHNKNQKSEPKSFFRSWVDFLWDFFKRLFGF